MILKQKKAEQNGPITHAAVGALVIKILIHIMHRYSNSDNQTGIRETEIR